MKMNLAPLKKPIASGNDPAPEQELETTGYRRLKFNELVSVGDYVMGKDDRFEPWDGPRGFQAGSFVQPIYRREGQPARASKKDNKENN